jgi:nickel/cobalt exporter
MALGWINALALGTWFGLLHALDADHLATIGGLSLRDRNLSPTGYALRWAGGHAASIGAIALLVLGLDLTGLLRASSYAELAVAIVLVSLGAWALRHAFSPRREMAPHTTAGDVPAHVHFAAPVHTHSKRGGRSGWLMGLLHGGAGSAGVLALLPLAHLDSPLESALYVLCFSGGVAAGAVLFAALFAHVSRRALRASGLASRLFRAAVGGAALVSGALLLIELPRSF